MTISELERFKDENLEKYNIKTNYQFLEWLKNSLDGGYKSYMNITDIQNLIDKVANWYEIKYPEKELEKNEGIIDKQFFAIKNIEDLLTTDQLLYRLSSKERNILNCNYRSNGKSIDENNSEEVYVEISSINKNKYAKNDIPKFYVVADAETGIVKPNYELQKYVQKEVNLDELLEIFDKKYNGELDYSLLKETVNNHKSDIELRHRLLQLTLLKLLYSNNTTPERGYERAKNLIKDFNNDLDLRLSQEEIDEIMSRDYTNGIKWDYVERTKTDEFGETFTFTTVVNAVNEDKKGLSTARKSELERYLKNENEVVDFTTNDLDYLKLANKIPFDSLLENLLEYKRNSKDIELDENKLFTFLLDKYDCTEAELEKRTRDVSEVVDYREKHIKSLVKERRDMINYINSKR
ncbi:MAG: hypothetical protein IJ568_06950 [Bacilli bacterium]|nr:hypothetical protein [Bacilli bacterium]